MRCGESELGKEPQDQVDRGVEFQRGKARGLSWMSQLSGTPVSPLLRLLCQGPPWSALQPPSQCALHGHWARFRLPQKQPSICVECGEVQSHTRDTA